MKKNLISVLILALVVVNFVLTALLLFTVLPETKKANELIVKVCSAIDLDLNSGQALGISNVSPEDTDIYQVNGGESMTINLKIGEDGKSHFAVLKTSLSLNKNSKNYKTYPLEVLATKDDLIRGYITDTVKNYTMEEFSSNTDAVEDEILNICKEQFGSDYVIGVIFADQTLQ